MNLKSNVNSKQSGANEVVVKIIFSVKIATL